MAYTGINKASDHFASTAYTGNQSARTITLGMQPDFVWTKCRNSAHNHIWTDSLTGAGKRQTSNGSPPAAQDTSGASVASFTSTGYTLTDNSTINGNSENNVVFAWKAGAGTTSNNTNGTWASTVSANQAAGFSTCTFTPTAAAASWGHGLDKAPEMIFVRGYTGTNKWRIYHKSMGNGHYRDLNTQSDPEPNSNMWSATTPDATKCYQYGGQSGDAGQAHQAFHWTSKQGYSLIDSYYGNGNADGQFVYCGFKPAFVFIFWIDSGDGYDYIMYSPKIPTVNSASVTTNPLTNIVEANTTDTENTNANFKLDFLSNGFKCRGTESNINSYDKQYAFYAVGQSLVGTNNIIGNAR